MANPDWMTGVFDHLRGSPLSGRILVFGSAANDGGAPNDVDIFVEADARTEAAAINQLMVVAHDFYGRFDPFVLMNDKLYTRNDTATGWVRARNADPILAAGRAGVPLENLLSASVPAVGTSCA